LLNSPIKLLQVWPVVKSRGLGIVVTVLFTSQMHFPVAQPTASKHWRMWNQ